MNFSLQRGVRSSVPGTQKDTQKAGGPHVVISLMPPPHATAWPHHCHSPRPPGASSTAEAPGAQPNTVQAQGSACCPAQPTTMALHLLPQRWERLWARLLWGSMDLRLASNGTLEGEEPALALTKKKKAVTVYPTKFLIMTSLQNKKIHKNFKTCRNGLTEGSTHVPLCLHVQNLGAEQQHFYRSTTQTHALQEQHKSQGFWSTPAPGYS